MPIGYLLVGRFEYDLDAEKIQPFLQLWTIPDANGPWEPTLRATFQFPFIPERFDRMWINHPSDFSSYPEILRDHDFSSLEHPLITLLLVRHPLVISTQHLLQFSLSSRVGPPVFPWAEWGPQSTCLLGKKQRVIAIWGQRLLFDDSILDFTPHAHASPLVHKCNVDSRDSCAVWDQIGPTNLPCKLGSCDSLGLSSAFTLHLVETRDGPMVSNKIQLCDGVSCVLYIS